MIKPEDIEINIDIGTDDYVILTSWDETEGSVNHIRDFMLNDTKYKDLCAIAYRDGTVVIYIFANLPE